MVEPVMRYNSALSTNKLEFDNGVKGDMLSFGGKSEMITFLYGKSVIVINQV